MPKNKTGIKWKEGGEDVKEKMRSYQASYKERHYERVIKNQKTYQLRVKYGLSFEDYEELLIAQEGRCAICNRMKKLHVDHCHETGKVRGLLCNNCNCGIGNLQDSVEIVKKALDYLS